MTSFEPPEPGVVETLQLHEPVKSLCLRPVLLGFYHCNSRAPQTPVLAVTARGIWPGKVGPGKAGPQRRERWNGVWWGQEAQQMLQGHPSKAGVLLMGCWGPGSGLGVSSRVPIRHWKTAPGVRDSKSVPFGSGPQKVRNFLWAPRQGNGDNHCLSKG